MEARGSSSLKDSTTGLRCSQTGRVWAGRICDTSIVGTCAVLQLQNSVGLCRGRRRFVWLRFLCSCQNRCAGATVIVITSPHWSLSCTEQSAHVEHPTSAVPPPRRRLWPDRTLCLRRPVDSTMPQPCPLPPASRACADRQRHAAAAVPRPLSPPPPHPSWRPPSRPPARLPTPSSLGRPPRLCGRRGPRRGRRRWRRCASP